MLLRPHFRYVLKLRRALSVASIFSCLLLAGSEEQQMGSVQRAAALRMLTWLRDVVKQGYYDVHLHGVDLDARYQAAKEKLEGARTLADAYGLAAWLLEPLDDSHTVFIPPSRPYRVENGWRMQFIGDRCFVTAVQSGSDAANQGLKPGDEVLATEGFRLDRSSAWKLQYAFGVLAPRSGMHLVVAPSNAAPRQLLVKASVQSLPKIMNQEFDWSDEGEMRMRKSRVVKLGDVLLWRLPSFEDRGRDTARILAQAREYTALILDLRGNPGGLETVLVTFLEQFLDHDVGIGEHIARAPQGPLCVKAKRANKRFCGRLVVLVDSDSESAAEIFARVIQLEKRGTVIGDRTSGRVMEARMVYGLTAEGLFKLPFGLELTVADLLMADGKSLEHRGVTPDELVLPTSQDLAAGRDPVLSRAAQLCSLDLSSEKAGTLLPIIWRLFR